MSAALDRELTADQMAVLTSHLESCANCSREFEELQQLDQVLRTRLPIPNADLHIERVEKAVQQNRLESADAVTRPVVTRSFTKSVLALSILALTIAGAVFGIRLLPLSNPLGPSNQPGPKTRLRRLRLPGVSSARRGRWKC